MEQDFTGVVEFLCIYIEEAHPIDEWALYKDVQYTQPKTTQERVDLAREYQQLAHFTMPMVVDTVSNEAQVAYAAWPERLYVIGVDGRVIYKGGQGPDDYKPDDLRSFLTTLKPSS
mmetsp:Transcript_54270/g.118044  ORF Transcript_54270/g.118044 Transcript_54270/m.118044 type:complete len:116 (-) Transcript_54270:140-487(-)